jgi:hypothetical protein
MKHFCLLLCTLLFLAACTKEKDQAKKNPYQAEKQLAETITQKASDSLMKALGKAMADKGVAGALSYCQINADSIVQSQQGKVLSLRRASDKNRNPNNKATREEKTILDLYKKAALAKDSLQTLVVEGDGDTLHLYRPIVLKTQCVVCHGKEGEEVNMETLRALTALYPKDKATGYKPGDIRGVWHVRVLGR